jgi:hypothetical protein
MRWLLKRWWFWAGAGFMLVAVVAGCLLIPVQGARITQESCDKIEIGWSREQVVSLLGKHTVWEYWERGPRPIQLSAGETWWDEDLNQITVVFRMEDGVEPLHVADKQFVPTRLSLFECIKRRVERRIRTLRP